MRKGVQSYLQAFRQDCQKFQKGQILRLMAYKLKKVVSLPYLNYSHKIKRTYFREKFVIEGEIKTTL